MEPIAEADGVELHWSRIEQDLSQDVYALRGRQTLHAVLRYQRLSDRPNLAAEAESAEGHWLFLTDLLVQQSLFIYRGSTVRRQAGIYLPSTMRGSFRGQLQLPDQQRFLWLKRQSGIGIREFTTPQGRVLLSLHEKRGRSVLGGTSLSLTAAAWPLTELPLLVLVSWYLRLAELEEAARQARRARRRRKA